jgi:hypothetical protein
MGGRLGIDTSALGTDAGVDIATVGAGVGNERLTGTTKSAKAGPFAGAGAVGTKRAAREGLKALGVGSGAEFCAGGAVLTGVTAATGATVAGKGSGIGGTGVAGAAVSNDSSSLGLLSAVAGRLSASMSPLPLSSQGNEISGKALIMRCTTSKLGLLRSLNI